jgi:hypothetical protein
MEASPALFPNRAGTIESRAARALDERNRRAAIRTVGRAGSLATLSAMSRSLRQRTSGRASSSSTSSDESDDDDENAREGRVTLRESLRSTSSRRPSQEYGIEAKTVPAEVSMSTAATKRNRLARLRDISGDVSEAPFTTAFAFGGFKTETTSGSRAPANSAEATPARLPAPPDDLTSDVSRRRFVLKLRAMEEPPILITPVQRKYIVRWVDRTRGTLRTVADVALAALKKSKTDAAYRVEVEAANEATRSARLERARARMADFKRSDPRTRWKRVRDALYFIFYVQRLVFLTKKAATTAAVRKHREERAASEAARAEILGENARGRRSSERGDSPLASADGARFSTARAEDPIAAREAESRSALETLRVTRRTLRSRFGGNRGDLRKYDAEDEDDAPSGIVFEPKLGQQNARTFAALAKYQNLDVRDMNEKAYSEMSSAWKEEERREARQRAEEARREFHWRPVTRVRLASRLPVELFRDADEKYDPAVVAAGWALRAAAMKSSGPRAERGARLGVDSESPEHKYKAPARTDFETDLPAGSGMDEASARAVALDRRRRAARLAGAYDANLDFYFSTTRGSRTGSRTGSGNVRELSDSEDERTTGIPDLRSSVFSEPIGGFLVAGTFVSRGAVGDARRGSGGDGVAPKTFGKRRAAWGAGAAAARPERRALWLENAARARQYGKWYVDPKRRDSSAHAASERRFAESTGGASASEVRRLRERQGVLARKHQKSYAARAYKSWLEARVGSKARIPSYMRDVEAAEEDGWWERSTEEMVLEENERLARRRGGAEEAPATKKGSLRFAV